jgi:hypothetical protein
MTLLSIAQDVAAEIGVVEPATLVGNADLTAKRMLAVAKAEGQYLYRVANWSILQREHEITTTADEENYPVPDDFGRLIVATAWDRTQYLQMRGGVTQAQWQRLRSSQLASAGIVRRFRLLAGPLSGSLLIDPVPGSTGDTLVYEYITTDWCESTGGTGQATWLADTDEIRLDEELFRLGLLWRTKRSLGLSSADERNDHELALRDAIKADMALDVVSMGQCRRVPRANLPEGSWNV